VLRAQGSLRMYREITACRICGNSDLVTVLDLGVQALTGVFPKSREQPITRGPLQLAKCAGSPDSCGLLQLRHTYDLHELYGDNYGYRSALNPAMVTHLHQKVGALLKRITPSKDALIIDIGANDGTTLKAYPPGPYCLVGIDPTGTKFQRFYPEHIQLIPEFFSAETVRKHFGNRKASVITSFSMFYDLESPMQFMQEIADVLDENGIWVFEQSYMPTMLRMNAYDTVCHEHLEYYGLEQILWMAERCGLKIIDFEVNDTNGGSFSVVAVKGDSNYVESPSVFNAILSERDDQLGTLAPYNHFARRVAESRDTLRTFLDEARSEGRRIDALGASTKGNVLLQYCCITESDISKVGEVNPDKLDCFTPGALLPIVSEADVLAENPDYLMLLPWHFRSFFLSEPRFAGRALVFPLPSLEVLHRHG
jgi:NDP-4-keto-2,6-dideoxyhexose 3-C-methyltransferase